ncbi:leucine-rich repeat domain-containing protein [Vallitalea okinawensis]|uniref:hypothetical protein n=1 Tax=Vallitalea okinawensis TaxID=2078660 RepID=UPI000CFDCCB8|nr:hypothetical protein [Vallitalea okinawensis]
MNRKLFPIMIGFLFFLSSTISVLANNIIDYEIYADKLKEINIFQGTGEGFELEREPNRIEGLVMFIRLIGKEKEANNGTYSHPFTDVPEWANNYIGWAYENGYTKGISDTQFGSDDLMLAKSYVTLILRALGYEDTLGDFSWNTAISYGNSYGLYDEYDEQLLYSKDFLRSDIAYLSYQTLNTNMKNSNLTLIQYLVNNNVISYSIAKDIGLEVYDNKIVFTDENLEQHIRTLLNNQTKTIEYNDVLNITSLDLSGLNIKNLDGLEYFSNLNKLDVSNNQIDKLESLHNLDKLEYLNIYQNSIKNLDEIRNLELSKIEINGDNDFNDLSLIENNIELIEEVEAGDLKIVTQSLSGSVKIINRTNNPINMNGAILRSVVNNKEFTITNNLVLPGNIIEIIISKEDFFNEQQDAVELLRSSDYIISNFNITPNLIDLIPRSREIIINDPVLRSVIKNSSGLLPDEPIRFMDIVDLQHFSNNNGKIKNLQGLEYFLGLNSIEINYSDIVSLEPIENLINLEKVYIYGNHNLEDITPLSSLTNLAHASLGHNNIIDISPLLELEKLKYVELQGNQSLTNLHLIIDKIEKVVY